MEKYDLVFTGSSKRITIEQANKLQEILKNMKNIKVARHGDCIVCDEYFHMLMVKYHPTVPIELHISNIQKKRAFAHLTYPPKAQFLIHDPKPPLERNQIMINKGNALIATPDTPKEILHSGTWSTIRYARKKKGMKIDIICPDGKVIKLKS